MKQNKGMLYLQGAASSKTFTLNTVLTAAIIGWAQYQGIELSPETAVMITSIAYMLLNYVLRMMTGKSLPEKALEKKIQKPEWVSALATEMIAQLKEEKRKATVAQKAIEKAPTGEPPPD